MFQRITLLGNVGRVEETRYSKDGTPVINFSLATSEGKGDSRVTEWWQCAAWDKLAGVVQEYVRKGDRLFVEGTRQTREYEKDGVTVQTWSIRVHTLRLLGERAASAASANSESAAPPPVKAKPKPSAASGGLGALDDDIPF